MNRIVQAASLVALATCALASCSGKQVADGPQTAPPALATQQLELVQDLGTFVLTFTGEVESEADAVVEKARWELVVDGQVVKTGEEPVNARVPAGEKAPFTVKVNTQYVDSAEQLQAMSERGGSMLTALRGRLAIDVGGKGHELEFARAREVRTPRLPTVTMQSLDAARYSEDEANILFNVGVVNPNPFYLAMSGLDFKVRIAGKDVTEGTRGRAEKITPSATGVFEVQVSVRKDTLQMEDKEFKALLKAGQLAWEVEGQLRGDLYAVPYKLSGVVNLPPPSR